jgi:thiamine-phosphate pyrophosphorylase
VRPFDAPCVCLVTDRRRLAHGGSVDDQLRRLVDWLTDAPGHVDLIQIREPDLDGRDLHALTAHVVSLSRGTGTIVLVNTRPDVARAAGAGGVHLRADGLPAGRVRAYGPDGWLIGRSAHDPDQVRRAVDVDYVIFGTLFETASKPGLAAPDGLDRLTAAVAQAACPVLAIGGVTPDRAAMCRAAGAAGIAAIGAFLPEGTARGAVGIRAAARAFRQAMAVV